MSGPPFTSSPSRRSRHRRRRRRGGRRRRRRERLRCRRWRGSRRCRRDRRDRGGRRRRRRRGGCCRRRRRDRGGRRGDRRCGRRGAPNGSEEVLGARQNLLRVPEFIGSDKDHEGVPLAVDVDVDPTLGERVGIVLDDGGLSEDDARLVALERSSKRLLRDSGQRTDEDLCSTQMIGRRVHDVRVGPLDPVDRVVRDQQGERAGIREAAALCVQSVRLIRGRPRDGHEKRGDEAARGRQERERPGSEREEPVAHDAR
jgi:hypothetical protein